MIVCAGCFGAYCRKIVVNVLSNGEDADECVNETWLKAWDAIPPAKPTLLRAFLGKITRNIAINRYNAAHAQKRGDAVEVALDELAVKSCRIRYVRDLISMTANRYRY